MVVSTDNTVLLTKQNFSVFGNVNNIFSCQKVKIFLAYKKIQKGTAVRNFPILLLYAHLMMKALFKYEIKSSIFINSIKTLFKHSLASILPRFKI